MCCWRHWCKNVRRIWSLPAWFGDVPKHFHWENNQFWGNLEIWFLFQFGGGNFRKRRWQHHKSMCFLKCARAAECAFTEKGLRRSRTHLIIWLVFVSFGNDKKHLRCLDICIKYLAHDLVKPLIHEIAPPRCLRRFCGAGSRFQNLVFMSKKCDSSRTGASPIWHLRKNDENLKKRDALDETAVFSIIFFSYIGLCLFGLSPAISDFFNNSRLVIIDCFGSGCFTNAKK